VSGGILLRPCAYFCSCYSRSFVRTLKGKVKSHYLDQKSIKVVHRQPLVGPISGRNHSPVNGKGGF